MNQKLNMLTTEGGLTITLKPNEVTWFRFLQASRTTNSLQGGWNSRSYWRTALNTLSSSKFIVDWTNNSLKAKSPPLRESGFMFDRQLSAQRRKLKELGIIRNDANLEDMSENELATRLYHDSDHKLWGTSLGYEIPLSAESEGQLKVDIFAIGKEGLEIVELKKAGNTGDSPLMALTEAICYGIQTIRCCKNLIKDSEGKKDPLAIKHFSRIRLVLAAPKSYWKYWNWNSERLTEMERIIDLVNEPFRHNNQSGSGVLFFDKNSICALEDTLPARI